MHKTEQEWREAFTAFASRELERDKTRSLFLDIPVASRFERNNGRSEWDLVHNPIMRIERAYPGTWGLGAEVWLKDGSRMRWDGLHGGGFWHCRTDGVIKEERMSYVLSTDYAFSMRGNVDRALMAAQRSPMDEEALLQSWVECDRTTKIAALYALVWMLSSLKADELYA
jgi:hypothetical protein